MIPTVRIVSDHPEHGGFIVINEEDFDETSMTLYQDPGSAPGRAELDAALVALPGDQTDPDYVVGAMRTHFGEVFTDSDETLVRKLVKAPKRTTAAAKSE